MGIVARLEDDYSELIASAVQAVHDLEGKVVPIPDGPVEIEEMDVVEKPMAGRLPLSKEVVEITTKAVRDAARAPTFKEALEVGYRAFGDVACTPGPLLLERCQLVPASQVFDHKVSSAATQRP